MRTMLLLSMLCVVSGMVAIGDDTPMTCAYYPIDYDPETGQVLFLVDEHPRTNGVVNCGESWGNLAWYLPSFDNWPEFCPNCTTQFESYAAIQDRPLKRRIPAASTLWALLPEQIPGKNGKFVSPRNGISQVSHHDIQVQPPGGGAVVSVRLFEGVADPTRAGAGRSGARQLRLGFETDRLPDDTIRPFQAEALSGRSSLVVVNYHGRRFPVMLAAPLESKALAARR